MSLPRVETGAAWLAFAVAAALAPVVAGEGTAKVPAATVATAAVGGLTLCASVFLLARGDRSSSWLCPTATDRTRMLEASTRVKGARQIASVALATMLLVCVPWLGLVPLLFCVASVGQIITLDRRIARTAQPERYIAASLAYTAGTIAAGLPWTGGPDSPLIALLALPAALMASRFRRRIVIAGLAWSLLLLLTATLTADPQAFEGDPSTVLLAVALLIGVTACTLALSENEMQFRRQSSLDHLTGLLNRSALSSAMAQVEARAAETASTVSVILYDIDHFKRVNDEHGHDVGDEVLVVTAQILQAHARPGDTVYRLGGEEFAVVLLSTDGELAMTIAERHRGAVERGKPAGLAVTISAGVASGDGPHATWDWLYQRADRALLEAKRSGRNRVLAAQELAPSARPSTPGLATAVPLSRLT